MLSQASKSSDAIHRLDPDTEFEVLEERVIEGGVRRLRFSQQGVPVRIHLWLQRAFVVLIYLFADGMGECDWCGRPTSLRVEAAKDAGGSGNCILKSIYCTAADCHRIDVGGTGYPWATQRHCTGVGVDD